MSSPIYLDYAATTPVDPIVAQKMGACLTLDGNFGNPASRSHVFGWRAEEAVEDARDQVAQLINADPREIVWTSGATEANNLAIKGLMEEEPTGHIISCTTEHKSVLDVVHYVETKGASVTWLHPDPVGRIHLDALIEAIKPDTRLVSVMHVNNETGVIQDIAKIGAVCRARGLVLHVDAAQSTGKLPLDVVAMNVDLLSMSAHKFYGPKGMGALYIRRTSTLKLSPQFHGGGHERGFRSGTLATHQIVGMGAAAELANKNLTAGYAHIQNLQQRFLNHLNDVAGVHINGDLKVQWPGILNLSFEDVDGEQLLILLKDLALSTGSACNSASVEPSYVLKAMGIKKYLTQSALRFSFGRFTTEHDIDQAAHQLILALSTLRTTPNAKNFV